MVIYVGADDLTDIAHITGLAAQLAAATGSGYTRTTVTYTTASLGASAQETGVVPLAPAYRMLRVVATRPCRLRLYATLAQRTADLGRSRTTSVNPLTDHGLILDLALQAGVLTRTLSPLADGVNLETGSNVALTIDNLDTVAGTVAVTLTYLRTE